MKHAIVAVALWVCVSLPTLACDVCGCSVGGNYFGILPQFRRHFVGVRYQYRSFQSEHPALFGHETGAPSKEYFHTAEVWGRWTVRRNLQLFGFVPYNHYLRQESGQTLPANGLGDASLIANWVVFNTGDSAKLNWKHALQLGGGIKLPTGNSQKIAPDGNLLLRSMQPGTGSWDFPLHAVYVVRYKRYGVAAEANYRVQTHDAEGYHFGNRLGTSVRVFHWRQVRRNAFLPSAGLMWEHAAADRSYGSVQDLTGGHSLWTTAGVDVFLSRVSLALLYQYPLSHYLGSGYIQPRPRISAGAMVLF